MADTKTKEAKISVKVILDRVNHRVVYAEADYSFVDILFSFMTLPLGTIGRILGKHDDKKFEAIGSLKNLYQSLKDFPECYFAAEECKFMLLNPRSVSYYHCKHLKLKIDDTKPTEYFICRNRWDNSCRDQTFSICDKAKCRSCGHLMDSSCSYYPDVCDGRGVFVSNIATFIVTDDFFVMPYTTEECFRLLTDLGITDPTQLEERKMDIGCEQMLYLVKMALSHGSPFTHLVFHSNTPILDLVHLRQSNTFDQCDFIKKETSTNSKKLSLYVSLQKSTKKFLFAEAKEDFVDFVFSFISIPLGTAIGTLMNGASSISCMDNLFKSILDMTVGRYLKSQDIKDMLVKPHFGQEYVSLNQVFPLKGTNSSRKFIGGRNYAPKDPRINDVSLRQSGIFFVTDDLVITPSSSHLAMNILNKLKVSFDDVEKHEISIGLEEGLRMLKASLLSKSTLTNSFKHELKKK